MKETKNWIWHQKFGVNEAVHVSSYFNISNDQEQTGLFKSSFTDQVPFNREEKRKKIGFKK